MAQSAVARLEQQIDDLKEELEEARANQFLTCPHCQKKTKLKKLILIRKHWYREPYGCTGGDYWDFDEYMVGCPKCSIASRVYKSGMKELFKFVDKNFTYFGEKLNWYPRGYEKFDINEIRRLEAERKSRR